MTPAEQKAWIAGRNAAASHIRNELAKLVSDEERIEPRFAAAHDYLSELADEIIALAPPPATDTEPRDRGKVVKPKPGAPAGGYPVATEWTPPPEADRPHGYEFSGKSPAGYWIHVCCDERGFTWFRKDTENISAPPLQRRGSDE
jgi:hypothetical protein